MFRTSLVSVSAHSSSRCALERWSSAPAYVRKDADSSASPSSDDSCSCNTQHEPTKHSEPGAFGRRAQETAGQGTWKEADVASHRPFSDVRDMSSPSARRTLLPTFSISVCTHVKATVAAQDTGRQVERLLGPWASVVCGALP